MSIYARARSGHRARQIGQIFENMIQLWASRAGVSCIRLPDGCRGTRTGKGLTLLRVRTPFDFCLFWNGLGIVLDAKTVEGSTFPHSAITHHQVISLSECRHARRAGYLVWYRASDTIAFHSATQLYMLRPRESLVPGQGLVIGSSQRLDLERLFADLPLTSPGTMPTK